MQAMTELTPEQDDKISHDRDDGSMLTMELRPRSPPQPSPSIVEEISEPSTLHLSSSFERGKDVASIQKTLSSDTDGSSHFTSRSSSATSPDLLEQGTSNTEPLHYEPSDAESPANLCYKCKAELPQELNTHPNKTGLPIDHIGNLHKFASDLQDAVKGNIQTKAHQYTDVHALLISWEADDLDCNEEISELRDVFAKSYHFRTERYIIPQGNVNDDSDVASFKAFRALSQEITRFSGSHPSDTDLLIIYYGGHGALHESNRCFWTASSQPESAIIEWWILQAQLEAVVRNDVLLVFDCCFAASAATRAASTGTKELLAACGKETVTFTGKWSFTRRFIYALKMFKLKHQAKSTAFTVADIYSYMLTNMKLDFERNYIHTYTQVELTQIQRTPVHVRLRGSGSICIAPLMPLDATTGQRLLPPASVDPIFYHEDRVVLTIAIKGDATPDIKKWKKFIQSYTPPDIVALRRVDIECAFKADSTLMIVSMPISLWTLLPERPAYQFAGFVRSKNTLRGLEIEGYLDIQVRNQGKSTSKLDKRRSRQREDEDSIEIGSRDVEDDDFQALEALDASKSILENQDSLKILSTQDKTKDWRRLIEPPDTLEDSDASIHGDQTDVLPPKLSQTVDESIPTPQTQTTVQRLPGQTWVGVGDQGQNAKTSSSAPFQAFDDGNNPEADGLPVGKPLPTQDTNLPP